MLKKASKKTVELIKEKILNTKIVELPITAEKLQLVYDWFESEEIALANAEADGEIIDQLYLKDVSKAVDELFNGDGMYPDLDYLNENLK